MNPSFATLTMEYRLYGLESTTGWQHSQSRRNRECIESEVDAQKKRPSAEDLGESLIKTVSFF
jgi:hypothetical protein